MSTQFAGSSSTGDRRRRRLAVNGESPDVESSLPECDGGEIESELVASSAAAPWVPATEIRIWIYAIPILLFLAALTFVLSSPAPFHPHVTQYTDHLLTGHRPALVWGSQALFLGLSSQLALLISWYRAQCKLDFGGRYLVWPWAAGFFGLAALSLTTNSHVALGSIVGKAEWLPWRGETVAWMLPMCLIALPLALLLDRDVRNNRSSLIMLRLSGLLWLAGVCLELYHPELQSESWFELARLVLPVFSSAALFLGLWLHARVVAYVCPDPPVLEQQSAWTVLVSAGGWIGRRLMFWRREPSAISESDDDKPKRRRKKIEVDSEETTAKRKRKPIVKKVAPRTRTRTKVAEETETDESNEETDDEEIGRGVDFSTASHATSPGDDEYEESSEAESRPYRPESSGRPLSQSGGRSHQQHDAQASAVPSPHFGRKQAAWQEESVEEEALSAGSSDSGDENDDNGQLDSGLTAEQMKGLSKRQKRDLKKQLRDQQRATSR